MEAASASPPPNQQLSLRHGAVVGSTDRVTRVADRQDAIRLDWSRAISAEHAVNVLLYGAPRAELMALFGEEGLEALLPFMQSRGNEPPADDRLLSALEIDNDVDPRGRAVWAGDEALLVSGTADLAEARAALRRWISTMQPDGRLRIYAAALTDTEVVTGHQPPGPEDIAAIGARLSTMADGTCVAVEWGAHELRELGGFPEDDDGTRLSLVTAVSESRRLVADRVLHQAIGLAPCANLAAAAFGSHESPRDTCAGLDWCSEGARRRLRGEATERFAVGDPPQAMLRRCAEEDLDGEVLTPTSVISYLPEQAGRLGLSHYDPARPEWWTRGTNLAGADVWVAASQVWNPFPRPRWLGPGAQTTNGAAAASERADARSRAWLEAVERDALLTCWWGGEPPRRVNPPDGSCKRLVRWLGSSGMEVYLVVMPARFDVCVIGALGRSADGVRLAAAAGAPGAAIERALIELVMLTSVSRRGSLTAENVKSPNDHAAFWLDLDSTERSRWFVSGGETDRDALLDRTWVDVERCGDDAAVWVDLRSPSSNLHVAKCVSPALVPLTFGYDTEPRGHDRLRGLPDHGPWVPHPFG